MVDIAFKDWLTIDETAAWLTKETGESYSAAAVERALAKGFLWPYYYPDYGRIGLFRRYISLEEDTFKHGGKPLRFIGPLALYDYAGFKESIAGSPGKLLGVTLGRSPELLNTLDGQYTYFDDVAYVLGENNEPLSLASHPHKILMRVLDLKQFAAALPEIHPLPRPIYSTAHGVWAACFDIYADEALTPSIDHVSLPQTTNEQDRQEPDDMPALRALGFAAHLIADLGRQLDEHQSIASKRLQLSTQSRKPVVSKIAKLLSDTATSLNHTGHGAQGRGFQEALTRALRELQ